MVSRAFLAFNPGSLSILGTILDLLNICNDTTSLGYINSWI